MQRTKRDYWKMIKSKKKKNESLIWSSLILHHCRRSTVGPLLFFEIYALTILAYWSQIVQQSLQFLHTKKRTNETLNHKFFHYQIAIHNNNKFKIKYTLNA